MRRKKTSKGRHAATSADSRTLRGDRFNPESGNAKTAGISTTIRCGQEAREGQ
jgi:hypothetical protein